MEKTQVNYDDFEQFMLDKFDEIKCLFERKREQYATGDPLANFRTAAMMNSYGRKGFILASEEDVLVQMYEEAKNFQRKHIAHIENNGISGDKVAESLGDIAVYCVIMQYMVQKLEAMKANKISKCA